MKKILSLFVLLFILTSPSLTKAGSTDDYAFFSQVLNDGKTIYRIKSDGSDLQALISGKNIEPFSVGKHFLYFADHQLFEFDLASQQPKLLTKFSEDKILIQELSGGQGAPDQVLVLAETQYEQNLYVIEFPEGSIRLIRSTVISGAEPASLKGYSPDEMRQAIIRQVQFNFQFEVAVQEKVKQKYKTSWTSPRSMTIIPELPLWSPNSQMIVFYAKEFDSLEGFYSLYLFNAGTKELLEIQEQVFSKFSFSDLRSGPFRPDWSKDSKYIIFQYQPYGLPTGSSIIKYEVEAGKKHVLTDSSGHNQYPSWSPSGRSILFLSDRETPKDQLYSVDGNGQNLKRLSPSEGYTEWAKWYQPDEAINN